MVYLIVREGKNPDKYFSGWKENGRPIFRDKRPMRFFEEDEAIRHAKWIAYMSFRVTKLKIVQK